MAKKKNNQPKNKIENMNKEVVNAVNEPETKVSETEVNEAAEAPKKEDAPEKTTGTETTAQETSGETSAEASGETSAEGTESDKHKIGRSYSVYDRKDVEEPEEVKRLNKKLKNTDTHSGVVHTPGVPDADPDAVVAKLSKKHYRKKKVNRSVAGNGILFFIMIICGIFMSLPLVMIINNCLKPLDEIFQYPPRVFVKNPTLENFTDLFIIMNDSWVPFSRYILNTLIITGLGTFGHVIVASLAAYPLAKHDFPGKKILFNMVVLSMMFSWTVTQIPNYMIISWLHINNTYLAMILPAWQYGMGLYLMKQFMEQLPIGLMESARLDGASEYQVFWKIVMPNVKPAWLTLAIFQFQQMWGNTGAMFLRDEQLKPLQFALQQIAAGGTARAGASAAVTFIVAAVPIIFFLTCQSNVLETMTTSGMKE